VCDEPLRGRENRCRLQLAAVSAALGMETQALMQSGEEEA